MLKKIYCFFLLLVFFSFNDMESMEADDMNIESDDSSEDIIDYKKIKEQVFPIDFSQLEKKFSSSEEGNKEIEKNNKGNSKEKEDLLIKKNSDIIANFEPSIPKKNLNDIVGPLPGEVSDLIDELKYQDNISNYREEKNCLILLGPPGTGKTSLAEVIASETGRIFYKIIASSLITTYQSSGSLSIKQLFDQIKKSNIPTVVFIDEIDALANLSFNDSNGESCRAIYQLHREIDELPPYVCCIFATNYFQKLPNAFKDRISRKVVITLPDILKRRELLKYLLKNNRDIINNIFFLELAKYTEGLSCRSLERICNLAIRFAEKNGPNTNVSTGDFLFALYKTEKNRNIPYAHLVFIFKNFLSEITRKYSLQTQEMDMDRIIFGAGIDN